MRLSSNPNHPDYPLHTPRLIGHCEVYLDGEKLDHCYFADEQRGIAEVHDTYPDGRFVIIGNETRKRILVGDVKIKPYKREKSNG